MTKIAINSILWFGNGDRRFILLKRHVINYHVDLLENTLLSVSQAQERRHDVSNLHYYIPGGTEIFDQLSCYVMQAMNHEWANVRTVAATASDQRSSYLWSIKEKFTTRPQRALSKNVIRIFKYRKNKDVTSVPDNASIDNGAGFVSFITNKWISRLLRVYVICALCSVLQGVSTRNPLFFSMPATEICYHMVE